MNDNEALAYVPGTARRHDNWGEVSAISSIGRRTMSAIPNYSLLKAATCIDATPAARLLLVHLIGYLGLDDEASPASRFVVFPGNTRLSDELRCTVRSIQRQADELESAGMIRRCYNGLNRRTGFDLAPFAMRHGAIVAELRAVHVRRREEAEGAQLELGLVAGDGIERPSAATHASSRGDIRVALNRPQGPPACFRDELVRTLSSIDPSICADVPSGAFVDADRREDVLAAAGAHSTSVFTRGGRTSSLAWSAAVAGLGLPAAVGLHAVASADPRRRSSMERYFSWLLRMASDPDGCDAVRQAAERASSSPRAARTERPQADPRSVGARVAVLAGTVPARGTESPDPPKASAPSEADLWEPMGPPEPAAASLPTAPPATSAGRAGRLVDAVRSGVGPKIFSMWLEKASFDVRQDLLVVSVPGAFATAWVSSHLSGQIARIADGLEPGLALKVERMRDGAVGAPPLP